jgi:hypothetical protein
MGLLHLRRRSRSSTSPRPSRTALALVIPVTRVLIWIDVPRILLFVHLPHLASSHSGEVPRIHLGPQFTVSSYVQYCLHFDCCWDVTGLWLGWRLMLVLVFVLLQSKIVSMASGRWKRQTQNLPAHLLLVLLLRFLVVSLGCSQTRPTAHRTCSPVLCLSRSRSHSCFHVASPGNFASPMYLTRR